MGLVRDPESGELREENASERERRENADRMHQENMEIHQAMLRKQNAASNQEMESMYCNPTEPDEISLSEVPSRLLNDCCDSPSPLTHLYLCLVTCRWFPLKYRLLHIVCWIGTMVACIVAAVQPKDSKNYELVMLLIIFIALLLFLLPFVLTKVCCGRFAIISLRCF
jgi:hypothetical protein